MQGRIRKGTRRTVKLKVINKCGGKGTRLYRTNVWPAATWGMAAMGVAPTSLKVLRSQAAGAVINKGGRCTTNAVAVGLPQGADPAAAVREAILLQWIGIWQDSDAGQRQRICKAWPRQLSKLVRADRWRNVYGPMRAYIHLHYA